MLRLRWLPYDLDVCRFPKEAAVPSELYHSQWFNLSRTETGLSVVCCSDLQLQAPRVESGWVMFSIEATEAIMAEAASMASAKVTSVLAKEGIRFLVCSSFDGDSVLVKGEDQTLAHQMLAAEGYGWSNQPEELLAQCLY